MEIAIRLSQKINSRIRNSRIAIRHRIAQLGLNVKMGHWARGRMNANVRQVLKFIEQVGCCLGTSGFVASQQIGGKRREEPRSPASRL